jgi:hypothetical protein
MRRALLILAVLGAAATALAWTEQYETAKTPWSVKYCLADAEGNCHCLQISIHAGATPSSDAAKAIAEGGVPLAKALKPNAFPKETILISVWFAPSSDSESMVKMPDGSNFLVYVVSLDKTMTCKKYEAWKAATPK